MKRCKCLRRLSVARLALRTGVRGGGRRGHGHPQLANAPGEHVLPGQDDVILRQATEGVKPVLQLIQSGISRGPNRSGRTTTDGIVIVVAAAGRIFGINLIIVHLGISLGSSTIQGGVTVDADSGDRRRAECNALGEALSMKRCSKRKGATPVPAEPSAVAEQARGEDGSRAGPRDAGPAAALRAAAFPSAAARASSCC